MKKYVVILNIIIILYMENHGEYEMHDVQDAHEIEHSKEWYLKKIH